MMLKTVLSFRQSYLEISLGLRVCRDAAIRSNGKASVDGRASFESAVIAFPSTDFTF